MTVVWLVVIGLTIAIAAMLLRLKTPVRTVAPAAPRKPSPRPAAQSPAIRAAPHPVDAGKKSVASIPAELEWTAPIDLSAAQRGKLRGRYLAARFPGVARTPADLLDTERMIRSARLYFEDRKLDRAVELLDLAIGQSPADESMPLARLELAFLIQDAALYVALASAFREAHPSSPQWAEVARLGRAIAAEEAMFGEGAGPRATDHYGPWPDMPNWIKAPWDLTAEVRATEFHQAMARSASCSP